MKKEVKIVMESMVDDETGEEIISTRNTIVYLNGEPIGCIQALELKAIVDKDLKLDITFPDTSYFTRSWWKREIQSNIRKLSTISNVNVSIIDLSTNDNGMVSLSEVGTEGNIDSVNIK